MYFKQFYLGCLAHASYMIGSDGEAAVVDPRRDVDSYIDEARAQGLEIRHIIETHLHADFVSGHQELAHRTGAKIYFGAKADAKFDYVPVREGDEIRMGPVTLRSLETPGHTPESISILVFEHAALVADPVDRPAALRDVEVLQTRYAASVMNTFGPPKLVLTRGRGAHGGTRQGVDRGRGSR